DRDQRVGVGGQRIGDDVFELAQLVAAEGEPGIAVLAFRKDLDLAAEMRREARQLLDRGGPEGERIALELFQHVVIPGVGLFPEETLSTIRARKRFLCRFYQ